MSVLITAVVVCDSCGESSPERTDSDELAAVETARDHGWTCNDIEADDLCPACAARSAR